MFSFISLSLQGLLAKSCLCPGFATLVSNLITSSNVEAQVGPCFSLSCVLLFEVGPKGPIGSETLIATGIAAASSARPGVQRNFPEQNIQP